MEGEEREREREKKEKERNNGGEGKTQWPSKQRKKIEGNRENGRKECK